MTGSPRIAFGGDRDVAVAVLDLVLAAGTSPLALLLPEGSSHGDALRARCPGTSTVFTGRCLGDEAVVAALAGLELDYVVLVHYPYLVPAGALATARHGFLNLHPAYLPYGRGWHTVTWALLEDAPLGATLHFMDEGVDTGDIVHQRRLDPGPGDTADTLYAKVKDLELAVFAEAWPALASFEYTRTPQDPAAGFSRRKADLAASGVQRLDLEESTATGELLRRLRALTTNRVGEAAYFEEDGRRYRVRVEITEEDE